MSEWISVKERLPVIDGVWKAWGGVLANAKRGQIFLHGWYGVKSKGYGATEYVWRTEFGEAPEGYITHWMEYPTAPTESEVQDK